MPDLQIENGVLIGREGELFLAGGRHDVLDYATGRRRVEPAAVQAFRQNIRRRDDDRFRESTLPSPRTTSESGTRKGPLYGGLRAAFKDRGAREVRGTRTFRAPGRTEKVRGVRVDP